METLTKVSIPTELLQDLVSRAVKGSSMIDKIPLTCLMAIKVSNKKLTISTTDNTNQLVLSADLDMPDFEAVVSSGFFASLVSKLSTNLTSLSVEDNKLIIEANGKYTKALPTDSDGSTIKFIEPTQVNGIAKHHITNDMIDSILTLNKSCKADIKEMPSIYNYYMDSERVLTTDFYKACDNPVVLFDEPTCINPALMELIPSVADEKGVSIIVDGDNIVFESSKGKLYGRKCVKEEVDQFPVEGLLTSFKETSPYTCLVNRSLLINAIERICLFVDVYHSNKMTITFNNKELKLYTDSTDSAESLKYLSEISGEDIEVSVDVDALFLKNQLNACNKEDITIKFGLPTGIQLQCNKTNLLLSVLGEDE